MIKNDWKYKDIFISTMLDKNHILEYNKSKEYNEKKECDFMELAKITSKGQITLPISIRRMLNLKEGDKVAFIEKEGNYIIVNPISLAIDKVRNDFKGEADRLGLKNEEDVVDMVKEIRTEKRNDK